jgi:hypothetical protein
LWCLYFAIFPSPYYKMAKPLYIYILLSCYIDFQKHQRLHLHQYLHLHFPKKYLHIHRYHISTICFTSIVKQKNNSFYWFYTSLLLLYLLILHFVNFALFQFCMNLFKFFVPCALFQFYTFIILHFFDFVLCQSSIFFILKI